MFLLVFLSGVAMWTLTEYLLHRFLGHVHQGNNFFKTEHRLHHARANYFAPAYKKAALAVVVSLVLFSGLCLVLPIAYAFGFVLGFASMYALYEMTHARYHSKDPIAPFFIALRKHHFYHHFHNPRTNHGVTTRFWDRVFGTFHRVERVNVPRQMSMAWLVEDEEIKPAYRADFRLK